LTVSVYFELGFRLTEKLASRPSIDAISAELEVLKSEHASLQQSLKESHEKETKTKKELEENHAQAMSEMAEKLKTSNNRVKTLVSKAKAYEAEASDIDELIFRKNFIFSGMSFVSCSSQLGV
jgi:chromosome segregation ATPase